MTKAQIAWLWLILVVVAVAVLTTAFGIASGLSFLGGAIFVIVVGAWLAERVR